MVGSIWDIMYILSTRRWDEVTWAIKSFVPPVLVRAWATVHTKRLRYELPLDMDAMSLV